jgi:zinc transport system substrate-binding protein
MKKNVSSLIVLFVVLALTACSKSPSTTTVNSLGGARPDGAAGSGEQKIAVSVTFNALAEIASTVGGDYVSVTTIIPDGMEPHNFEPKAKDLVALGQASVFVYNGLGLEYWVKDALVAAGNSKLVSVDASAGIEPIKTGTGPDAGVDPHGWLSLSGAKIQTENIANALEAMDPEHAESYAKNAASFEAELEKLHSEYREKFAKAPSKAFVTGHAAFGYLCRDFGLEQNSVEDVFASGEPNAQALVTLVRYCRERKVKTIFVEEMVSPAISRTLANEVGAKVETIYTLESSEEGKSWLDRMKANLEKIDASLGR